MRHRVNGRKFGRESGHRNLMLKNLVKSLVEHGKIHTTLAKAKEIRSLAERLITYGKKNTVHHRRLAYRILQNRTLVKKVFDELAPQFSDREGGYTRLFKSGFRRGDAAAMAIIEFIQKEKEETDSSKKKN